VLDVAINLYFRNLGSLLKIAAAVVLPVVAIVFLLDLLAFQEAEASDPSAALYQVGDSVQLLDETRFSLIIGLETLIGVIGYLLVVGAVFRAASQAYVERSPETGASIRYAARRMHSLLWVGFLFVLGVGLATIALVLPGIWLFVAWSVAIPALMVEDVRGSKALGRSFGLVRHNWWRTFAALLVGLIFIGLLQFLIGLLSGAADGLAEESVILWAGVYDVLNGISTIITAPLQAAIVTVIYYDLRVRKEGFDVELLTRGLEEGSSVPAQSAAPPPGSPGSPPSQ